MAPADEKKNIVIIGGGIIGCSSAYFLTRHPSYDPQKHSITLLESTKIAGGASGKAGGLLALWAYPSNLVPLSYRLHAELAKEHGGEERWGYRRINCGQLSAKGRPVPKEKASTVANGGPKESESLQKRSEAAMKTLRAAGIPAELDWVAADSVYSYDEMGTPDTTAQVHPYYFTTSMAALAEESGVKIITGAHVKSINSTNSAVDSVTYTTADAKDPQTLPCTTAVLAAGPWTRTVLPNAPIAALRAHSVTIRPTRPVSAFALFTSIVLPASFSPRTPSAKAKHVSPEMYARPNNEVYCCGEGDRLVPLPGTSADVAVDDGRCEDIIEHVGAISDELRDGEVTARQACYLPVCEGGGGPFIGDVPGAKGLVLAAGHTCWGIQNGPGTGKVVSEIVMDGKATSVRLGNLDPRKGM